MSLKIETGEDGHRIYLIGFLQQDPSGRFLLQMEEKIYPLQSRLSFTNELFQGHVVVEGIWENGIVLVHKAPTPLKKPDTITPLEQPSPKETSAKHVGALFSTLIDNMRMPGSMLRTCFNCQTSIPEESKFCMECGEKQPPQ